MLKVKNHAKSGPFPSVGHAPCLSFPWLGRFWSHALLTRGRKADRDSVVGKGSRRALLAWQQERSSSIGLA